MPLSSNLWQLQQGIGNLWQLCEDKMGHFTWTHALLCFSPLVFGQSSTSHQADGLSNAAGSKTFSSATATIDGTPTRYSVAFTVPAEADVGPSMLPNVLDPDAKQAQELCPGYTASNVQKTANGFNASLSIVGEPVRYTSSNRKGCFLILESAMSTVPTWKSSHSAWTFNQPIVCGFESNRRTWTAAT